MYSNKTIHSFNEIPYFSFKDQVKSLVKKEINEKSKDYILNVEEIGTIQFNKKVSHSYRSDRVGCLPTASSPNP